MSQYLPADSTCFPTKQQLSSVSTLGPATKFLSSDSSAMARFSLDLRELEAVNVPNTLREVSETQILDT